MKAFFLVAMLLGNGLAALGQAPEAQPQGAATPLAGEKQRIAVLPLRGTHNGLMGDQSDTLYQKVTSQFLHLKRFDVIERAQLSAVLNEGKFQSSGLVDDASAVSMGKQLGVQFVILGSWSGTMNREVSYLTDKYGRTSAVVGFPGAIAASLRMVDVQTGRIKASFEAKGAPILLGSPADSLASMMKDLDKKMERSISNEFPLLATILKVINEKEAMIDLGAEDGVKVDDPFAMVEVGEDIVHPKTGAIIKGEKRFLAELKVTRVDSDKAYVKVSKVIVKGAALKPGMDLESQPKKAGFWEQAGDALLRR